MKITNSASVLLKNILEQKNKSGFKVGLISSGCSKKIKLELTDEVSNLVEINGINLSFDGEAFDLTENITIDEKDGKLVIVGECTSGCSC